MEVELFYCEELNKHLATAPGATELRLELIPRFACYDCNRRCSLQRNNRAYLDHLIGGILDSKNGHIEGFKGLIHEYKARYEKPKARYEKPRHHSRPSVGFSTTRGF